MLLEGSGGERGEKEREREREEKRKREREKRKREIDQNTQHFTPLNTLTSMNPVCTSPSWKEECEAKEVKNPMFVATPATWEHTNS